MTLLGKIFSFLIFMACNALLFMTVSVFQTHTNWKDVVMRDKAEAGKPLGLKFQIQQRDQEIDELKTQVRQRETELRRARAARAHALAALEEAYQGQLALRKQADEANALLAERERQAIATAAAKQASLDSTVAENVALRGQIRLADQETDVKRAEVVAMSDQVNAAQDKHRQLQERQAQLVAQIARMKAVLDKFNLNEYTPLNDRAPSLDGVVLAVKDDFVEISIGSDDGLREGHKLDVFYAGAFKGRVTVRKVAPDRAVGEIQKDIQKGDIERGQLVKTRNS